MSDDNQQFNLALRATKRVLIPLFRALIRLGVTLPSLLPVIKSSYVEAAQGILKLEKRKETISQIHIMTGVHRKDLKSILAEEVEENPEVTGKVPLWAAVLSEWRYNPRYDNVRDGKKVLPKEASSDPKVPSFFDLVKTLSNELALHC